MVASLVDSQSDFRKAMEAQYTDYCICEAYLSIHQQMGGLESSNFFSQQEQEI